MKRKKDLLMVVFLIGCVVFGFVPGTVKFSIPTPVLSKDYESWIPEIRAFFEGDWELGFNPMTPRPIDAPSLDPLRGLKDMPWHDSDRETPWEWERVFYGHFWTYDLDPMAIWKTRLLWYQRYQRYGDVPYPVFPPADVDIAVLDSGVNYNIKDLKITWNTTVEPGMSVMDNRDHGTKVMSIVGAKRNHLGLMGIGSLFADVYMIKIADSGENITIEGLKRGIQKAVAGPDGIEGTADDADVISMSIRLPYGQKIPKEEQKALDKLHNTIKHYVSTYHTVFVASNGNDFDVVKQFPSDWPEVISVGGTNFTDGRYYGRQSNPFVEMVAPGKNVKAYDNHGNIVLASGTSFATPMVAVAAALIIWLYGKLPVGTENDYTVDTIRGILHMFAYDLGTPGKDNTFGWGLLQLPESIAYLFPGTTTIHSPTPPITYV